MRTIWSYEDGSGDRLDLDEAIFPGNWTIWVLTEGHEANGVWLERKQLLALYHAIGDELRAVGELEPL